MKNVLIASILSVFSVVGCKAVDVNPVACNIAKGAAASAAEGVAKALSCSNVAAVTADIQKPVDDLKICQQNTPQGTIGDLVCPSVAHYVVAAGVKAIPAAWGCTGGPLSSASEAAIVKACADQIGK